MFLCPVYFLIFAVPAVAINVAVAFAQWNFFYYLMVFKLVILNSIEYLCVFVCSQIIILLCKFVFAEVVYVLCSSHFFE